MASGDDNTIVNYHDIYVQQTNNDCEHLDRVEAMSTNPTPPPTYNQLPATGISSSASGSSSRIASTLTPININISGASGSSVVIVHGSGAASTSGTGRRGDPPTYEEAINTDPPPPSYDSLFGRVREAHKASTSLLDFLKNVVILLLGTLGCTIILGITIVIPVCMIVFGSIYLYDCPQGEYIPVYLLVGGGFGVLKQLLHLSTRVRSREEQELERLRQSPTQTLINCFMLGWFIIGSFWIYRIYEPNYDPAMGKYCNKSLYLFTFWLITSVYMTLGIITVVLCGVSIISIAIHRRT